MGEFDPSSRSWQISRLWPEGLPWSAILRVKQFKYLGRIVSYDDNDTPAIRRNIKKARRQWGQFRKVLERDSVPARVAGMYYQAVIASVLL